MSSEENFSLPDSFTALLTNPKLLQAVTEAGYTQPTEIQARAIPVVLAGRDLVGCAQTGTGKTAGYTLPMIEKLASGRARARMPRSLVLAPTREIALQVADNFTKYSKHARLSHALLIGGMSPVEQERALLRGVDVLIATPGRMIEQYEKGKVLLGDVKILVIDEADRMLDMGFIPDVEKIIKVLPMTRQTLMFSATMPEEIRILAAKFLHLPDEITITPKNITAETVEQHLIPVNSTPKAKREALLALLHRHTIPKAIIFCNRKRDVSMLAKALVKDGMRATELHGDMRQHERNATLERFKDMEEGLLVASDVAARGIHINALPAVINYDVPGNPDDYVHRIGRTGRAGAAGHAFTLVTEDDDRRLAAIRAYTQATFIEAHSAPATPEKAPERREKPVRGRKSAHKTPEKSFTETAAKATPAATPESSPASSPASSRPGRPGTRESEAPVKGLGDHVPAFLLPRGK